MALPSPHRGDGAATSELVAATAANLAGWHDLNLRSLGHRTAWQDGWWLTDSDAPVIFFRAIAIRPGADPAALDRLPPGPAAVCDPWADLDLRAAGMTVEGDHPWMCRGPGPVPAVGTAEGLVVERVEDVPGLVAFEATAAVGFGMAVPRPHTWHGPSLLHDPRFHLWVGRASGTAVATANAFVEAGVVGIYSVSTVPSARRRGSGTMLTARALSVAPGLRAVLQPSAMAESLYRRLGFERFTTFRTWTRSHR